MCRTNTENNAKQKEENQHTHKKNNIKKTQKKQLTIPDLIDYEKGRVSGSFRVLHFV